MSASAKQLCGLAAPLTLISGNWKHLAPRALSRGARRAPSAGGCQHRSLGGALGPLAGSHLADAQTWADPLPGVVTPALARVSTTIPERLGLTHPGNSRQFSPLVRQPKAAARFPGS